MNIAITEIVNERLRKRAIGMMGSATRDSIHTSTAAISRPTRIRPPTIGSVQFPDCLLVRPTRIGTSAATSTEAPR